MCPPDDVVPLWLDVDVGHDDAFAILLATTHPRARLLGISTVFGNATLDHTTYNTRAILKAIGRGDVPVFPGAAKPFCRKAAHAADIHGETGLDGTTCLPTPDVPARTNMTAVEAMRQALSATPYRSAWLVATGALTNVALLLALYPGLVDHIAGLSIMGGAVGPGFAPVNEQDDERSHRIGNWTAWAEFNIYVDPESANSVFSNPSLAAKINLITLDLTHQFLATAEVRETLLNANAVTVNDSHGVPVNIRRLFVEILTFFAKTYSDVFGLHEGPPLHDPLAVAIVLEPELFDAGVVERFDVEVVTDGAHGRSVEIRSGSSHCGQTLVMPSTRSGGDGVRVPRTLNEVAAWSMINEALHRAEARVQSM